MDHRRNRAVTPAVAEKTWLRILGTLNEYQARLFVAEKAFQLGRGRISRLSQLTGMSRITITQGLGELRTGGKLRTAAEGVRQPGGGPRRWSKPTPICLVHLKMIVERAGHPISSVTLAVVWRRWATGCKPT